MTGVKGQCDHESCQTDLCLGTVGAQLDWVRAQDREHPARICLYCFHPRNSDECQFATKHASCVEFFSGEAGSR